MELKLSVTKERALTWSLLLLALTPLVVTSFAMFPFVIGKVVFIRTLVTIFLILFSVALLHARRDKSDILSRFDFGFLKNPIFLSLSAFLALGAVSVIFSPSLSRAFFGTLERGEGYIQLFFLSILFVAASIVFKSREWITFFRLTALVGIIVAGDVIIDFLGTGGRPKGSFINNPAFIAAYLLFVLFAAFVLIARDKKASSRYMAFASIALAIVALGATNTRGALVGLFAGVVVTLVYFVMKAGGLRVKIIGKSFNLKKLSVVLIVSLLLFLTLFVSTINGAFWDRIPGLDRLSEISLRDNTTQSRLITMRTALRSVDPRTDGAYRFLFGYGPDNFNVAYNSHYDPSVQRYEDLWFDRAHNKVLEVLVTHGLLGLLAYLSLWYFVVRAGFGYAKRSAESERDGEDYRERFLIGASVLFFAVAYFVQNLFLFDQAVTYIPVFMFFAFAAYLSGETKRTEDESPRAVAAAATYIAPILSAICVFLVVLYAFVPFYQTIRFVRALKTESVVALYESLDTVTEPYNFAQPEIRFKVLDAASTLVSVDEARPFIDRALELNEEALMKDPFEPRYFQVVGFVYDSIARIQNEPELYLKAEELLRKALSMIPGRQEIMFLLAQNLLSQGRIDEAHALATEMLAAEPNAPKGRAFYTVIMAPVDWDGEYGTANIMYDVYVDQAVVFLEAKSFTFIRNGYNSYLKYYYEKRDSEGFRNTLDQALVIEEFLGKAQQAQLEAYIISTTYEIRDEAIRNGIDIFARGGWDAIKLE